MSQRNRNQVGSHDAQQHLRYVEVYAIGDPEEEDQPVQVKALKWDGDSYEVYGDPFLVGDAALADETATSARFWVSWRRDSMRWERISSALQEHYQIVRGSATAAVTPVDVAFQIEGVGAYEQFAATTDDPLWVAAPADGVTLAEGDFVWAIYKSNVLTFDPGGGDVQVDWLMFEPGSSNTPPLREFRLTATKLQASGTATVKWLDIDANLVGSDVTIADPRARFAGKAASYVGSELGFRGLALLRTDLAAEDPDQWEIIAMERFAEWAVVAWNASGETWHLVAGSFGGDEWNNRRPVADGAALDVNDPAALVGRTPANGETTIVRLTADADTPTYQIHGVRNEDRRVAITSGDTVPLELLSKVISGGAYDEETDSIAKVEEVEDGGIKKLRIAYTPGSGGGGFTAAAGCGIEITGTTTKTFTFDYDIVDTLAGLALTSDIPCRKIANVMILQPGLVTESEGLEGSDLGEPQGGVLPIHDIGAGGGNVTPFELDTLPGSPSFDRFIRGTEGFAANWKRHLIPTDVRTLTLRDWAGLDWVVADDYEPFAKLARIENSTAVSSLSPVYDEATETVELGFGECQCYVDDPLDPASLDKTLQTTTSFANPFGQFLQYEKVVLLDQRYGFPLAIPIGGDKVTVLIEETIDAAEVIDLEGGEYELYPGSAVCKIFTLVDGGLTVPDAAASYKISAAGAFDVLIENHLLEEVTVAEDKKYVATATRNQWGRYVLDNASCKDISFESAFDF